MEIGTGKDIVNSEESAIYVEKEAIKRPTAGTKQVTLINDHLVGKTIEVIIMITITKQQKLVLTSV